MKKLFSWFALHPDADAGAPPPEQPGQEQSPAGDMQQDAPGEGDGGQQPELLNMTQEEFDSKIQARLAREKRKWAAEAKQKVEPPKEAPEGQSDADTQQSALMLEKGKNALLKGTVLMVANGMELSERSGTAALSLMHDELSACVSEDGEVDAAAVKDVLADFAKAWPEFVKPKETPPPYAGGTGSQSLNTGKEASFAFNFAGVRPKPEK